MPQKKSGPSTSSILLSTALFVVVMLALGGLGTNVIATMRRSADIRDDDRAFRAAQSAVRSLKDRLSTIAGDHATSDVAYQNSTSDGFPAWAFANWGKTNAIRPPFDGAVVTGTDGRMVMATYKGVPTNPSSRFGGRLAAQAALAKSSSEPVVDFVKTWDGVDILASTTIRPNSYDAMNRPVAVLSLYRHMRDADIGLLAEQYQLKGLRLYMQVPPKILSIPLRDFSGNVVAYLGWERLRPGTLVYGEVRKEVVAAGAILIIFVITVVFAGGAESRRMARMAELARYEASHDGLSGLLNRSGLLLALERHLGSGDEITLHLLDLDGFKAVNDAWGHQIGDVLIKKVSEALLTSHPEIADAARFGGDEFALVQRGICSPQEFTERVLSVFSQAFEIEGRTVEVGASLGSAASQLVSDPFELLRRADMALYRAKADGKGRAVTYQPELDHEREQLAVMEKDLERALMQGAITVAYQPLTSAASGRVSGVEALARWHTSAGSISPEVFIPVAERSGLIDKLGLYILREAIRNATGWPDLTLSVNVSPVQICNPSFANSVKRLLDDENFEPTRLTLEITEGVLMSNPDQAQRAINDLREIGVRFSLDDFGCGYASIGALRKFGFDSMKIDRSLVWAAEQGRGADVLKATVALATALSIPVTAEGIETKKQADLLREAGCDQLQGYLVGRPMSAEDLSRFRAQQDVA
jgi:diguanylate cyclase (GGDEF)-like protein